MTPAVSSQPWGLIADGRPVTLHTLRAGALSADIMDYGGVIVRLCTPDREGRVADVVLGHDHLAPYLDRGSAQFFGALIGRFGNRIARGRFTLDGQTFQLACNDGRHALHGGIKGFDQQLWTGRAWATAHAALLELRLHSPDGTEGYPGNLDVVVTYALTPDALEVSYHVVTDAPTIVNLTQHTYWNLSGDAERDVLGHELTVAADRSTPVDNTLIPTGDLLDVTGTPFDFRTPQRVGEALLQHAASEQLRFAGGYDHNFVLRGGDAMAVRLHDPVSGRTLTVETTEPGVQVYSGNFLDGSMRGKGGRVYARHWGLCLETQHFPDSPNQPDFPSVVLRPGQTFESRTRFSFGLD
ncbi:aldose epimerase family protein [Deinococcus sp. PESE-13]